MTTGQAPIRIKTGNALDVEDTTSNVAINQAMMEALSAANIDGKDVYPNYVGAQHLSAADAIIHGAFKAGSMMIGAGGVNISSAEDGETPTTGLYMGGSLFSLYKSGVSQVTLDGQTGNASFKGTVYADAGSFRGSLVTGNISVGSGGVTISNDGGSSGIYIGGNRLYCKYGGNVLFDIDGALGTMYLKGELYASKITIAGNASNSVDLTAGSVQIGGGAYINSVLASTVTGGAAAGASAVQPGNGFGVNASNQPSTIQLNSSGITISTASSGARLLLNNAGLSAIAYVASAYRDVVTLDSTNGIRIVNYEATPATNEKLELCYHNGSSVTVQGELFGINNEFTIKGDQSLSMEVASGSGGIVIQAGVSSGNIYLYGPGGVHTDSDLHLGAGITLNDTGSGGPTITAGSGAPSASEPDGSIYLSTGGSFWVRYSGAWKRVWHDGIQSGTVAHTHS